MVRLLYFASLRESIGQGEESIELPAGITTVSKLIDLLERRDASHAKAFAHRSSVRCAINQQMARPEDPVSADDEVAFFPPVTGG